MRFYIDDPGNETAEEMTYIATVTGNPDAAAPELFLFVRYAGSESGDYIGQWKTRTRADFEAAQRNAAEIIRKAAENGFFRLSDLVNFELW